MVQKAIGKYCLETSLVSCKRQTLTAQADAVFKLLQLNHPAPRCQHGLSPVYTNTFTLRISAGKTDQDVRRTTAQVKHPAAAGKIRFARGFEPGGGEKMWGARLRELCFAGSVRMIQPLPGRRSPASDGWFHGRIIAFGRSQVKKPGFFDHRQPWNRVPNASIWPRRPAKSTKAAWPSTAGSGRVRFGWRRFALR